MCEIVRGVTKSQTCLTEHAHLLSTTEPEYSGLLGGTD